MGDSNYAAEVWEWDNIFLLEQDTGVIPWYGDLCIPQSTTQASVGTPQGHGSSESSLQSSHIHPSSTSSFPVEQSQGTANTSGDLIAKSINGEASSSTPVFNATNISEGSLESSDYNHHHELLQNITDNHPDDNALNKTSKKKKKKRDPRLDCPNFLAGRIPCACPEEDALVMDLEDDDVVKKKPKLGARCQVPSCLDDISHLKGYHQRHRVCLKCANAPKVILKDGPHRYCQQCGKFHRLSDFDEGKRSCRRKLERHNKRRRRRPLEGGENQENGDPDCDYSNENNQNAIVQEEWNKAVSTKQTHQRKQRLQKRVIHTKHENKVEDPKLDSPNQTTHTSDDSSTKLGQEIMSSEKTELETQSLLTMLMEDTTGGSELANLNIKSIHHTDKKAEVATNDVNKLISSPSGVPSGQIRHARYVAPYPTGRVSFKLYDWNPADFPRRLRQQIFGWLANMPVELEGYIRSGCIIMTFFIAMPEMMWDRIMDGWISHMETLLLCPGIRVFGTSQLSLQNKLKSIYIQDGKVMDIDHKEHLTPYLLDLYPPSLEAGCHTHVYICGFNFSGGRFFVSFGEQYLECSDSQPVSCHDFTHSPLWESIENLEIQRVTVFCPDNENFGPAFVEVNTANGVSNFMPVLVTDKYVCDEVNSLMSGVLTACQDDYVSPRHSKYELLRPQWCLDVLADLGWTFRYPREPTSSDKVGKQKAFVERLERLLMFSIEHNLLVVLERLAEIALTVGVISCDGVQYSWNTDYTTLTNANDIFTSQAFSSVNMKTKQFPSLTSLKDEISSASSSGKTQGSLTREDLQKKLSLALKSVEPPHMLKNSDCMLDTDYTIMEMKEMIPLLDDTLEKQNWAESLNWCRRPRRNTVNAANNHRRLWRIVVGAVSVVSICTGMCFMLQHPHEVVEMSMSFRRCLWGSNLHT